MNALHVAIPDYTRFEEKLGLITPYVLWNTVDGPLCYRWMDLAYESDFDQIVFHVPPQLDFGGSQLVGQSRWPVDVQWRSGQMPDGAERYESLFGDVITQDVTSEWELIDRHWVAVTNRLALLWQKVVPEFSGVRVGRLSRVEPGVRLEAPYWIGSDCLIGRNAVIGPGTVISDGCVIGAGAFLESTYVGEDQFVAEDTKFDGYHLQDGVALNRKKQLGVVAIDQRLLRTRKKSAALGWWEIAKR
jgi:hypothetical protein